MRSSTDWSTEVCLPFSGDRVGEPGKQGASAFSDCQSLVTWRKNLTGRYTEASRNYRNFFRLSGIASPVGCTDRDLFPVELALRYEASDQLVMQTRKPLLLEDEYNGSRIEILRVPIFDEAGEMAGIFAVVRDLVSQRTSSRAEKDSIGDHSPDIILRFNRQGLLIYCNPAALRFAELREADVIGLPVQRHKVLPAGDAHRLANCIAKTVSSAMQQEIELNWATRDGERHVHMRLVPEFDALGGSVVSVLVVGRDLTSLQDTRARLRKSHEILRKLAIHRQQEQEAERRDITHRIHEDLAQDLSALRMHLLLLGNTLPASNSNAVALMKEIADRCIARIRDMVTTLRPSVLDLGIVPALEWLAEDFREGLQLQISLDLAENIQIPDETSTFLFRATQEALFNTALHGAAKCVAISLHQRHKQLTLSIHDDGRGFHPEVGIPEGAFGLLGISEQARHLGGSLRITSAPGQGTHLEIDLPLCHTGQSGELFPS